VSNDVVSAEEAQGMLDRDRIAREVYGMHGGYDGARLARTVLTLHRELAVLRAQLAPLLAVHDALVAAAALPGAGASPEAMVAAVRAQASADARDDLARIGRLVGCDSLVGVEIHAAVEHELLERDAARNAAERAERERDDARAEVETLRAEAALMRSIIEGRTTPAREAFDALGAAGGTVHYIVPGHERGWFPAASPWWPRVAELSREGARLWAHDADGRPCAWPTVTP
jgi:hypothetical protein